MGRVAVVILVFMLSWPAVSGATPTILFEESALLIEGASPGGAVAVMGLGRDRAGFLPHQLAVWEVVTTDAAGVGRVELGSPVPAESSWAVVDLAAGQVVLSAPEGTALREREFPGRGLHAALRTFDDARGSLVVLWARPDAGGTVNAWGGAVVDGSDLDGDGRQDRAVRVLLDRLESLGGSAAPPPVIEPGDVLVGIDTDSLEIYALRLGS